MRIVQFSPTTMEPVTKYESTGAASAILATGAGETRIHGLHFEPGGQIGRHPAGCAQLFLVVQGRGWAMGEDGHRVNLAAGQGVFFERGEHHAKGSDTGMAALMVQVDALELPAIDARRDLGILSGAKVFSGPETPGPGEGPPALELHTPRLLLRPFTPSDAMTFSEYRSDPEVARYQGWEAPFELSQARAFIADMGPVVPGTPGAWYQLAICLRDTGAQVGDVAFRVLADDARQGEVGFTLSRAHQGHGYATEAVRALVGHLFDALHLHRILAICDVENPASARVLERVGFRREGETREAAWFKGHWSSEYWYAILRRDWGPKRES